MPAEVLYVSKPVAPPWNDSSKNLVRDLTLGLTRYGATVMGRKGTGDALPGVGTARVYPAQAGGFAPALMDNARVMGRLVLGGRPALWHFFFAPNPKSSMAGRLAQSLRRVPTVHTVCSAPAEGADLGRVLFADRTVVLSAHTERRFVEAGVPADRVVRIPPAIAPLEPVADEKRSALRSSFGLPESGLVLGYPGDLEFGGGAGATLRAFAGMRGSDATLVMACRAKTAAAKEAEAALKAEADSLGLGERVVWIGETPRIHELLATFDVCLLPSSDLYAKMDYPLVVLEAMSLGVPCVVGAGTPAEELCERDAALAVTCDADGVRGVMEALAGDEGQRRAVGAAGRERVLASYTRAPMAAAYEALYDELLSG